MTHPVNSPIPSLPYTLAVATVLLCAAGLSGCGDKQQAHAATAAPAPVVSMAEVVVKPVMEVREFSGRLQAVDSAQLRPRVSGHIEEVHLAPGTLVRKGTALFVIDPRPYRMEVDRLAAALAGTRVKVELAKGELDRATRLLSGNAIAQRDYDDRLANLRQLEAAVRVDEARLKSAQLNLEWTVVRAPFDGRVGKADVTVGNLVDSTTVLSSIVSSHPMYVLFEGDEGTYYQFAGLGRRNARAIDLRVTVSGEAGLQREAKLDFVDNHVNPDAGSVTMRALVDNKDHALSPGLSARVQVGLPAVSGQPSVLITERAVGTDQNRQYVYVVSADQRIEYRAVELGSRIEGLRVIRAGLKPGERIVVDGLQRVRPGAVVDAKTVPMTTAPDDKVAAAANSN
jgi:multidrug efflux system membrane fusion protein